MVYGTQRNGWLTVTVIDTVRPKYKIRMVKGGPTHPWGGGGGGGGGFMANEVGKQRKMCI